MEHQEVVYIKTIREIAEEIGVSKQAVFKKISRQPLSTELNGLMATIDGRLLVSVDGERLIKRAYGLGCELFECQPSTEMVDGRLMADNSFDGESDGFTETDKDKNHMYMPAEKASKDDTDCKSEVLFLRKQIEQMNDQLSRRDTMIDSLQKELEKEREHNREKDMQLLDTLSKLAETQAALAVGQSAEKQKVLAETLIDGQQKMDEERRKQTELSEWNYEEGIVDDSKKQGFLQRIWSVILSK